MTGSGDQAGTAGILLGIGDIGHPGIIHIIAGCITTTGIISMDTIIIILTALSVSRLIRLLAIMRCMDVPKVVVTISQLVIQNNRSQAVMPDAFLNLVVLWLTLAISNLHALG